MKYELIRSRRKTLSLCITDDERIVVKAPLRVSQQVIDTFVNCHQIWIGKNLDKRRKINKLTPVHSKNEIEQMRTDAKECIFEKVEYFSNIMQLKPTEVKITSAKKRFGSCSPKNSLCFSLYLMDESDEFINYVVIHELAHIKHHNHSANFWNLVKKYCPNGIPKSRIEEII